MAHLSKTFIRECKQKLIDAKVDILNRISANKEILLSERTGGDSADLSHRMREENELLSFQNQWRRQLSEIEYALAKIDAQTYGVCEETEEPIEPSRLQAIPWTRFSLEGAEMRDSR